VFFQRKAGLLANDRNLTDKLQKFLGKILTKQTGGVVFDNEV
jgi:hypothetical protein